MIKGSEYYENDGNGPQGNYSQFPANQSGDGKAGDVDHPTIDFLRFSAVICSLISFSCIASVENYGKQSALGFACTAAVILWVYSMGMLCLETYVYRLHSDIMPRQRLENLTRIADGFMLFFIYTATVSLSVISVDFAHHINNLSLVHAGAVFIWLASISQFTLIFYRDDGMSLFRSEIVNMDVAGAGLYGNMEHGVTQDTNAYSGTTQQKAEQPPSADL